jgi:probable F420-dependent oxidoreductase
MYLGAGLVSCQEIPTDPRSTHDMYSNMLEFGRAAEAAGFDSVWTSEHHFSEDGYMPSTMVSLGGLAAVTDDVDLGTYITPLTVHNPYRIAEDTATVDVISGGRLRFGVGLGYLDREFEGFGIAKRDRVAYTEECIRVMRDAWSDGSVEYESSVHDVEPGVEVTPKPHQDPSPPILIGGTVEPAFRRAALLGDGWVAPAQMPIDDIVEAKAFIEDVREAEGLDDDFGIYAAQWGYVGNSEEDAWETVRDGFLHIHGQYREFRAEDDRVERLRSLGLFGSPAKVAEGVDAYRDALGDDLHFMFRTYYPNLSTEELREGLQGAADVLVPEFSE